MSQQNIITYLQGYLESLEVLNTNMSPEFDYRFEIDVLEVVAKNDLSYRQINRNAAQTITQSWFSKEFPDEHMKEVFWESAETFFDILDIELLHEKESFYSAAEKENWSQLIVLSENANVKIVLKRQTKEA